MRTRLVSSLVAIAVLLALPGVVGSVHAASGTYGPATVTLYSYQAPPPFAPNLSSFEALDMSTGGTGFLTPCDYPYFCESGILSAGNEGDFYFYDNPLDGGQTFWANNTGEQGVRDVTAGGSFTRYGVTAVLGHTYEVLVETGFVGTMTVTAASPNQVTLAYSVVKGKTPQAWYVSLSSTTNFAGGDQSVTLTATASQDVAKAKYGIYILDTRSGAQHNCSSGTTCQWTVAYNAVEHDFVARVGMFDGSQTQATSSLVPIVWGLYGGGVREQNAVAWATQQVGSTKWDKPDQLCEGFAEIAFGTSGKYGSAALDYEAQLAAGEINANQSVPAGALAFFQYGKYGHVMLSIGNGIFISSSVAPGSSPSNPLGLSSKGRVGYTTIALASSLSEQFLGWSWAEALWPGR